VVGVPNSQELIHEQNFLGYEDAALSFVRTMSTLGDKLGPLSSFALGNVEEAIGGSTVESTQRLKPIAASGCGE
jgi:hypothetical protein